MPANGFFFMSDPIISLLLDPDSESYILLVCTRVWVMYGTTRFGSRGQPNCWAHNMGPLAGPTGSRYQIWTQRTKDLLGPRAGPRAGPASWASWTSWAHDSGPTRPGNQIWIARTTGKAHEPIPRARAHEPGQRVGSREQPTGPTSRAREPGPTSPGPGLSWALLGSHGFSRALLG
jgi:hypothetical protein